MSSPSEAGPTEDTILGGRVRLRQPGRGYRVAIDPVLLAAAISPGPGERVLDAGTGSGAAALCLARRCPGTCIVGLERDVELLGLARENAVANSLQDRLEVVAGDLLSDWRDEPFDQVMSNPPFHARGRATPPAHATAVAAHQGEAGAGAWVTACLARLRSRGRITLIHRPEALPELLAGLAGRAGDVVVYPLWPTAQAPAARRVILAARKGAHGPARLARGLVLHGPDGRYTEAAEAVLRHAAPLEL
ncbi:MAG: tRNA1(Val) (adenine(37)-N6)-methyltransferase [Geminicoccaceae bacterium]